MQSFNKVMLMGRLGADPENRQSENGLSITNFSLATNNTRDAAPAWHRVVAFGKTADLCQRFLSKGQLCLIEGRLNYQTYEAEDRKHKRVEIVAQRVEFIGGRVERSHVATPETGLEQAAVPFSMLRVENNKV